MADTSRPPYPTQATPPSTRGADALRQRERLYQAAFGHTPLTVACTDKALRRRESPPQTRESAVRRSGQSTASPQPLANRNVTRGQGLSVLQRDGRRTRSAGYRARSGYGTIVETSAAVAHRSETLVYVPALPLARAAALTAARLLTTGVIATLLALLMLTGLVALVSVLDVCLVVVDTVEVSVIEVAQRAAF